MALGQVKVNGSASAGSFYGYQPLVIKVTTTNLITASTGGTSQADPLVEGGYEQAVRAVETLGSIVWLGGQDGGNDVFTCVVDGATFNAGAGQTTAGAYGALKDALASALGASASSFAITTSSALNGVGTFTFA